MFMWIGLDFDVCWTKEDPIEAKVDVGPEIHLCIISPWNSVLLYLCLYLLMYACLGLYTFSHLYFVEGDIWGFVSVAGGGFSLPQWVALLHKHTDLTLVSILTGIRNSSSPSPLCASKNPISRKQKDNGDKMTVSLEFFSDFQKRVMYLWDFLTYQETSIFKKLLDFQEISRAKPPHQLVTSPYHLYYKTAIIWPKSTSSSLYVHLILGGQPSVKRALRSDRRKEENCSRNRNNWTSILRETCKKML